MKNRPSVPEAAPSRRRSLSGRRAVAGFVFFALNFALLISADSAAAQTITKPTILVPQPFTAKVLGKKVTVDYMQWINKPTSLPGAGLLSQGSKSRGGPSISKEERALILQGVEKANNMRDSGQIDVQYNPDPSVMENQLLLTDGTKVEGLANIGQELNKIAGQPQLGSDPHLNTDIKAVCAVLQKDRVKEEIPKFEAENAQNFPVKGSLVDQNDLANGSVKMTILEPFLRARENHHELLNVLKPANPSGGSTTQPPRPKSTEWQKKLIEYIRNKEVAEFNAKRPGAEPISPSQYHFTNVEGEKTEDCAKGPNGEPLPGPVYEDQQPVPPLPPPGQPPDIGPGSLPKGGNAGSGGGGSPFNSLGQLLRQVTQSGIPSSLLQQVITVAVPLVFRLLPGGGI